MNIQNLYSKVRKAIDNYNMIDENDKIAIGISGGKDSLCLLYALSGLRNFYPKKFSIVAISVDLGFDTFDLTNIRKLCDELNVEYHIVKTNISKMIADKGCSVCAHLRRGALDNEAIRLNCNKIAYAHNMDDVVETVMLSLMYEGRFSTFWPVTEYEDNALTLIRPMVFVPKKDVNGFCNKFNIQVTKNPCPFEKKTQRTYVRELLGEMEHHAPGTKKRIIRAVMSDINEWKVNEWN